jgi:hypothetical protein
MERIAIGGKFLFVARAAYRRGLHPECGFGWLQDGVRGMAIGANRGLQFAGSHGVAMGSALVVVVDFGMAGAAGLRDIRLVGRTGRIVVT